MRWLELQEFDFHHRLPALPGVTLVLFGQAACSACTAWQKRLEQWQPAAVDQLAHVDVQQCMALAHQYDIFHLPTLLVFVQGQYHGQLLSPMQADSFDTALRHLLAEPPAEEP